MKPLQQVVGAALVINGQKEHKGLAYMVYATKRA
jgi:hypothetical protein